MLNLAVTMTHKTLGKRFSHNARNNCAELGMSGGQWSVGRGGAAVPQKVAINCAKSVRLKKAKSVPS